MTTVSIELEWLEKQAKRLVKKHWGMETIPAIVLDRTPDEEWNNFLVEGKPYTLWGLYHPIDQTVEFNTKVNTYRKPSDVVKTLLHELCHWYLHIHELPYRDTDSRFACELIRVGLKANNIPSHQLAFKEAKRIKRQQVFEVIENSEFHVVTRFTHNRKDENDFKRDLKSTVIRMKSQFDEDGNSIYIGDLLDNVCEWYGYKALPSADYSIILGGEHAELSDEADFEGVLEDIVSDLKWVK